MACHRLAHSRRRRFALVWIHLAELYVFIATGSSPFHAIALICPRRSLKLRDLRGLSKTRREAEAGARR